MLIPIRVEVPVNRTPWANYAIVILTLWFSISGIMEGQREVLAFAGMAVFPSFWPVLLFWMAKSLFGGFVGVHMMGLHQKNLAKHSGAERNAIIAGMALFNVLIAIGSTLAYGFIFSSIAISKSMVIAVGVMALLGLVRLAVPYLMFDRSQRRRARRR